MSSYSKALRNRAEDDFKVAKVSNPWNLDPEDSKGYQAEMPEYSRYQKKVIERYYDHRDQIMLTRLGEIVTELYLADTEAKAKRLWSRAESAMKAIKVPAATMQHILQRKKPELLADHLRDWLAAARKAT